MRSRLYLHGHRRTAMFITDTFYKQCGTCSTKIYFLCRQLDSASRSQQVLVTHIVTHILPVSLFGNSMT